MQPVQKISKTRKRNRRSHHALKPFTMSVARNAARPSCLTRLRQLWYVNPKLALQIEQEEE